MYIYPYFKGYNIQDINFILTDIKTLPLNKV